MFKKTLFRLSVVVAALTVIAFTSAARADTFGSVGNQFTIDFVPISGDASGANGTNIGQHPSTDYGYRPFTDPGSNYRMGVYEITNAQWNIFQAELAVAVTGNLSDAYDESFRDWGTGTTNVPANNVSWYEAAQMVNWLNTSTDHLPAYKFTGTQGTSGYALDTWSAAEAAGGTNLFRHKDAFYFLPTEDEWVKAAYWNGSEIQYFATKAGEAITQGNGTSGTGWNYRGEGWGEYATDPEGPWNVGSGSEELNGTFDMMGNNWEWMESPWRNGSYDTEASRGLRGGYWALPSNSMHAYYRCNMDPTTENFSIGFRVASVPEPGSTILLLCGLVAGLIWWRRRK